MDESLVITIEVHAKWPDPRIGFEPGNLPIGKSTHNGITVSLVYQDLHGGRINDRRQVQRHGDGLIGIRYANGDRQPRMRTGRILTPPDYHDLIMVSRTLVRAQYEYWDDESVILDLKGNIVRSL